jgi:hypothetical protein
LFSALPEDALAFFVATTTFGLCAWFEIFRMFDQRWSGRIHLVGNRDSATYLQYELVGCIALALGYVVTSKLVGRRVLST